MTFETEGETKEMEELPEFQGEENGDNLSPRKEDFTSKLDLEPKTKATTGSGNDWLNLDNDITDSFEP